MAVSEVAALSGTIISIASALRNLGNGWYKASNEGDDLPRKLEALTAKHKVWVDVFAKYGMLKDSDAKPLIDALGKAERLLKAEEDKLEKRRKKGKPTEKAIRDALFSHAVVLLYGAPGKGKSALARAIALEYKEAAVLFEDVFYFECGPGSSSTWSSAVQFKLLQCLGVALNPEEEAGPTNRDFSTRLQRRLKDRKLFIILDDVWDGVFLREMVNLSGSGIKCLVTSQLGDLCQGLTSSSIRIPIEDIELQDARKILAVHVGFSHHIIPGHLEKITDEVIQEIERNPLALAIIGGSIETRRSDEAETWEVVTNDLFAKLDVNSMTCMNNMQYPRSLWATMKRSFEGLEKGAQSLLILVGMCGGLSIPEEVIQLLYGSIRAPEICADFAKLRQDLENREMVKIAVVSELKVPRKERSWSIHSLQEKFIEGVLKDERDEVLTLLRDLSSTEIGSPGLGPEMVKKFSKDEEIDEEDIVISLAALYFNKQFKERACKRAALKLGIPFDNFKSLRRSAIEPMIRLLGQPISKRWTKQLHASAKRVFMGYISSDTLNDNDISDLLVSPISILAMINVLGGIIALREMTLLDGKLHKSVNVLINLVENENDNEGNINRVQEAAHEALAYLCANKACRTFIATKLPRVRDTLIRQMLTNSYPESIRRWSVLTLGELCRPSEGNVRETIVQYPGFLACLMELLSLESNLYLRQNAIFLVGHLAIGPNEIKLKLVNTGVLLEELVKLLLKDDECNTQRYSTFALAMLAKGVEEVKVKMLEKLHEIPSTMDRLSRLLAEHLYPLTQYWATIALTLIYPTEGNAMHLYSGKAYQGRGYANLLSGNYKASLADLDKALDIEPNDIDSLRYRSFVLAKLGDYPSALLDANKVLEIKCTPFHLQERGVLKYMMGDLPGALEDLDKGLEIETDDYERLKHRGYVKFLMNDKVGAGADAEWALRIKPSRVDDPGYGRSCLGTGSIEYMSYMLR